MSLSDCGKCWSTPCECGEGYKDWTTERIKTHIDMLQGIYRARMATAEMASPSQEVTMDTRYGTLKPFEQAQTVDVTTQGYRGRPIRPLEPDSTLRLEIVPPIIPRKIYQGMSAASVLRDKHSTATATASVQLDDPAGYLTKERPTHPLDTLLLDDPFKPLAHNPPQLGFSILATHKHGTLEGSSMGEYVRLLSLLYEDCCIRITNPDNPEEFKGWVSILALDVLSPEAGIDSILRIKLNYATPMFIYTGASPGLLPDESMRFIPAAWITKDNT